MLLEKGERDIFCGWARRLRLASLVWRNNIAREWNKRKLNAAVGRRQIPFNSQFIQRRRNSGSRIQRSSNLRHRNRLHGSGRLVWRAVGGGGRTEHLARLTVPCILKWIQLQGLGIPRLKKAVTAVYLCNSLFIMGYYILKTKYLQVLIVCLTYY
jgi:hypothetical protein